MSERPQILGVVNVTPDSFSDGGEFFDPDRAARHAEQLWSDGAHIVDIGAASSHPAAARVPADEEIRRLAPVLDRLAGTPLRLSIDSSEPETQRYALGRGVRMLNDVTGFPDPSFHPELAAHDCMLVVMHALQSSAAPAPQTGDALLSHIEDFFRRRVDALERAGVARERIVLDPGMGFFLGRGPRASLYVLHHLSELRERLDLPLLVGVSRKSFLGSLTDRVPSERGAASLAAELEASARGADYIRTHDVRALRDGLRVQRAIASEARA